MRGLHGSTGRGHAGEARGSVLARAKASPYRQVHVGLPMAVPVPLQPAMPVGPVAMPLPPAAKSPLPATSGHWLARRELQTCGEVQQIGGSSPT